MSEELKITGVLTEILPVESGVSKATGKEWKNRNFVIETVGDHSKPICFTLFGEKIDLIDKFGLGDTVEVKFNVESRPYNGKYFSNINAWFISGLSSEQPKPVEPVYASSLKQDILDKNAKKANEPEYEDNQSLPF